MRHHWHVEKLRKYACVWSCFPFVAHLQRHLVSAGLSKCRDCVCLVIMFCPLFFPTLSYFSADFRISFYDDKSSSIIGPEPPVSGIIWRAMGCFRGVTEKCHDWIVPFRDLFAEILGSRVASHPRTPLFHVSDVASGPQKGPKYFPHYLVFEKNSTTS